MTLFPLNESRIDSAVALAADLYLRGADALYVAIAHEIQVPLVTWDNELLERAAVILPTYTPETVPFKS